MHDATANAGTSTGPSDGGTREAEGMILGKKCF